MVHRVIGLHGVDHADLHLVADGELPFDVVPGGAGRLVDQLPARVGRGRGPVDLDHVVFPFDAAMRMVVTGGFATVVLGVRIVAGGPGHHGLGHELHRAVRAA